MKYVTLPTYFTKQEYSFFYFKWSKYVWVYICYLFSNQPSTVFSEAPTSPKAIKLHDPEHRAHLWWRWWRHSCSPLLSRGCQPPCPGTQAQNCQRWEQGACMYVFLCHLLGPTSTVTLVNELLLTLKLPGCLPLPLVRQKVLETNKPYAQ